MAMNPSLILWALSLPVNKFCPALRFFASGRHFATHLSALQDTSKNPLQTGNHRDAAGLRKDTVKRITE